MAIGDAYGTHPTYDAIRKHNKQVKEARALLLAGAIALLALVAFKKFGKAG